MKGREDEMGYMGVCLADGRDEVKILWCDEVMMSRSKEMKIRISIPVPEL